MLLYFFTKEGEIMKENNLKGLWIPYEILTNENLIAIITSRIEEMFYFLIMPFHG